MRRYTFKELAHLLGSEVVGNVLINGFSIDSRSIRPGELFFALSGQQVEGHAFLAEVASKGALAAVVANSYQGDDYGLLLIHVDDVLEALQHLAQKILARDEKKTVVGITGSVGKTTTKEFTSTLLKQKFRVNATPGNSNSQIGLPLAILNQLTEEDEVLVLEMGMTHPGNIRRLVQIAPPDIAVVTSVALVHACNFEHLGEISLAKGEILSHSATRLGILHREIEDFNNVCNIGSCRKLSFSVSFSDADYYLRKNEGKMIVSEYGKEIVLDIPNIPGEHNLQNFLAATAVARNMGLSWGEIQLGMFNLQLPERRLQRIEKDGVVFINDSYNASLLSMKAALKSLPDPKPGGKKIAVMGEMLELGKFSVLCHREVGECALEVVDRVFCLGKECEPIWELWQRNKRPVAWFQERLELVAALRCELKPGDVVLLKGSRAKQLWKVIEEL